MIESGSPLSVLLLGATGQVGVFALPALLADAFPVLAISRTAPIEIADGTAAKEGHVIWIHPDTGMCGQDTSQHGHLQDLLEEVGMLLSVGPVTLAVEWASRCPRLRRVVCVSTSSIHTKRNSPDDLERNIIGQICRAEDNLKSLCTKRDIALALLRPTLIYGAGLDQNVSRIARLIRRFHVFPIAGSANGLRQPVHAADLAGLVLNLAKQEPAVAIESDVAGGSTLTYREMVRRIFVALGMKPRIVPVPSWLLAALVPCVAWLPGFQGLNSGFVLRQKANQVFDDSRLRKLTGFSPRPFEPSALDFELPTKPSYQADAGAAGTRSN